MLENEQSEGFKREVLIVGQDSEFMENYRAECKGILVSNFFLVISLMS